MNHQTLSRCPSDVEGYLVVVPVFVGSLLVVVGLQVFDSLQRRVKLINNILFRACSHSRCYQTTELASSAPVCRVQKRF